MKHNLRIVFIFMVAALITISYTEYCFGKKSDNTSQLSSKCAKKCTKDANYMLRVKCFTNCIEKNPTDPVLYFQRGATYRKIFIFNSAISDFIKVVELEPENIEAYYAIATTASLAFNKESALLWLQKAFEAGFTDLRRIALDPYLDNIRKSREFKDLINKWDYKLSSLE